MKTRVDKLLAANGWGSRRDIKRLMRTYVLTVNGHVCVDPATYINLDTDVLHLRGEPLLLRTTVYLMLNKPAGVVSSTLDPLHKTVLDLLGPPWASMDLHPVGRLDYDTEGLLLLTNDGQLTHRLTSPKAGIPKRYHAQLRDPVDDCLFEHYVEQLHQGVTLKDGYTCLPAQIERISGDQDVVLTICEGKYHQVKKMFRVLENKVIQLTRLSMGPISLDSSLAPGEVRELSKKEIDTLREIIG
ncbi:MAG TPA: pseudouridine synthase [Treponema sp.]|nr:pseudouridine synthase [Treponema sp.]